MMKKLPPENVVLNLKDDIAARRAALAYAKEIDGKRRLEALDIYMALSTLDFEEHGVDPEIHEALLENLRMERIEIGEIADTGEIRWKITPSGSEYVENLLGIVR